MKFNKPKTGDHRVKKYFAIFPITANYLYGGNKQTRWLSFVNIYQRYSDIDGWENKYFID